MDYMAPFFALFGSSVSGSNRSHHADATRLLLERALMAEKQQDARGGSLLKHALRSYVRPYVRCRTRGSWVDKQVWYF